jgi:hypothetical protein
LLQHVILTRRRIKPPLRVGKQRTIGAQPRAIAQRARTTLRAWALRAKACSHG